MGDRVDRVMEDIADKLEDLNELYDRIEKLEEIDRQFNDMLPSPETVEITVIKPGGNDMVSLMLQNDEPDRDFPGLKQDIKDLLDCSLSDFYALAKDMGVDYGPEV